jgi:hypothetical protein
MSASAEIAIVRSRAAGTLLVLVCLHAAPTSAQAPLSRSDSLLLEIASALVRGRADANALWFEQWFGGEFMLIRPEGGVLAVLARPWPVSLASPISVHPLGDAGHVGYLLAPGPGLPDRFTLQPFEGSRLVAFPLLDSIYSIREPVLATVSAVFHEAFHLRQLNARWFFSIPREASNAPPRSLIDSQEFQELAARERALLAQALEVVEADSLRALLRTYLDVRATRSGLFPADVNAYEAHEERKEASAELIGYRAGLESVDGNLERLVPLVRSDLENTPPFDDPRATHPMGYFRQWHIYATGAAIGILLERLGVDWREEMQRGATFVDLLSAAVTP